MTALAWSEWQDAIVRKIYSARSFAERRRLIKAHLHRLAPRTKQQVYHRAIQLGILQPLKKSPPWTEPEAEIVEKYAHYQDATISRKLKAAGFTRSENAVHCYRQRHANGIRQGKIDAGIYTACQAAELLGSSSRVVTQWVAKGWLKARRGGQHGPNVMWEIKADDLRQFVIDHVCYCDLSRADKFALIDLLCPHGAKADGMAAA